MDKEYIPQSIDTKTCMEDSKLLTYRLSFNTLVHADPTSHQGMVLQLKKSVRLSEHCTGYLFFICSYNL